MSRAQHERRLPRSFVSAYEGPAQRSVPERPSRPCGAG
jgi:hypothetical protein